MNWSKPVRVIVKRFYLVAISASHFTFKYFLINAIPATMAATYCSAYIKLFFTAYMIKFENNGIALATVYAGVLKEILVKPYTVTFPVSFLSLSPLL